MNWYFFQEEGIFQNAPEVYRLSQANVNEGEMGASANDGQLDEILVYSLVEFYNQDGSGSCNLRSRFMTFDTFKQY